MEAATETVWGHSRKTSRVFPLKEAFQAVLLALEVNDSERDDDEGRRGRALRSSMVGDVQPRSGSTERASRIRGLCPPVR